MKAFNEEIQYFVSLGKSLSPYSYRRLASDPLRQAFRHFLFTVVLSFILLLIICIPVFISLPARISEALLHFDRLEVDIGLATSEPVKILPGIVINTTAGEEAYRDNSVVITSTGLGIKPLACIFSGPYCLLTGRSAEMRQYADLRDILQNKGTVSSLLASLAVLMLPSALFILMVFEAVKAFLVILAAAIIGYAGAKLLGSRATAFQVLKAALYASTVLVIPGIINLRFSIDLYYIPLFLYIILLSLGIYMIGEKKANHNEV